MMNTKNHYVYTCHAFTLSMLTFGQSERGPSQLTVSNMMATVINGYNFCSSGTCFNNMCLYAVLYHCKWNIFGLQVRLVKTADILPKKGLVKE